MRDCINKIRVSPICSSDNGSLQSMRRMVWCIHIVNEKCVRPSDESRKVAKNHLQRKRP